jgi:hypothetical protein
MPSAPLTALADLVRACIAELARRNVSQPAPDSATVVVTAAPVFAANPYARARLLRQLHACGLLDPVEPATPETAQCLGVAK